MSIPTVAEWAGVGRLSVIAEIRAGRLGAVWLDGQMLIPFVEAQRWIDALPTVSPVDLKQEGTVE